jgi:hypothetical protein
MNDTIDQVISLNTLASNFLKRKKYTNASKYYNQALQLVGYSHSNRKGRLLRMLYSNLA